jgi:S-adenosylmethionine:tRNA ribosyltransferase-isomerase
VRVISRSSRIEEVESFWSGELDYALPEDLIAQVPAPSRESSRLMVLDRAEQKVGHSVFRNLGAHLPARALLVANDSKVFRARLRGTKRGSGGAVEALLLSPGRECVAPAMVRASKSLREGQVIDFPGGVEARVVAAPFEGRTLLDFAPRSVDDVVEQCGELPLPPYIARAAGPTGDDLARYQTVYADAAGSVAAPTAGLHFTPTLLEELAMAGFEFAKVTLHVGPGTFTPVRGDVASHRMEEESFVIPEDVADRIAAAKSEGRAVIAVGTTTVRALESAAIAPGVVGPGAGRTSLFIRPGHRFRVVDALVTNFHLPGSTLLALVMALGGRDLLRSAYETAVRERYRFYSYGDAMLIR